MNNFLKHIFVAAIITAFASSSCSAMQENTSGASDIMQECLRARETVEIAEITDNGLLVTPENMPTLYAIVENLSQRLKMQRPPLYIVPGFKAQVPMYTRHIVLGTQNIELFPKNELTGILAHELSHIKLGHYKDINTQWVTSFIVVAFFAWLLNVNSGYYSSLGFLIMLSPLIHSCKFEKEADLLAVSVLDDLLDLWRYLKRVRDYEKKNDPHISRVFHRIALSHPTFAARKEYIYSFAKQAKNEGL